MEFRCHYCQKPLNPDSREVTKRVQGWEEKAGIRVSGTHGGSDILLRETHENPGWAHLSCVRLERAGVSARQVSLKLT